MAAREPAPVARLYRAARRFRHLPKFRTRSDLRLCPSWFAKVQFGLTDNAEVTRSILVAPIVRRVSLNPSSPPAEAAGYAPEASFWISRSAQPGFGERGWQDGPVRHAKTARCVVANSGLAASDPGEVVVALRDVIERPRLRRDLVEPAVRQPDPRVSGRALRGVDQRGGRGNQGRGAAGSADGLQRGVDDVGPAGHESASALTSGMARWLCALKPSWYAGRGCRRVTPPPPAASVPYSESFHTTSETGCFRGRG